MSGVHLCLSRSLSRAFRVWKASLVVPVEVAVLVLNLVA